MRHTECAGDENVGGGEGNQKSVSPPSTPSGRSAGDNVDGREASLGAIDVSELGRAGEFQRVLLEAGLSQWPIRRCQSVLVAAREEKTDKETETKKVDKKTDTQTHR